MERSCHQVQSSEVKYSVPSWYFSLRCLFSLAFSIHFVIQYSYEKSRMGYCVLIRDKAEERASVWMAGRSMPRVGFFCSRPFSSINQRAKVLSADLTRAR